MIKIFGLRLFWILGLMSLIMSCQSRYGQIPRTFSKKSSKHESSHFSSHFVREGISPLLVSIDTGQYPVNLQPVFKTEQEPMEVGAHQDRRLQFKKFPSQQYATPRIKAMIIDTDTMEREVVSRGDATFAFGLVAGLNLLMLIVTPAIMLFILLALVFVAALFYLVGLYINEIKRVLSIERQPNPKDNTPNEALERLRIIGLRLLIVSAGLFGLALVLVLGSAFIASFVIANIAGILLLVALAFLAISLIANVI